MKESIDESWVGLWCSWPLNFHHYDCIGDFNGGVGLIFDRCLTSAAMVFLPQLNYLLDSLYENAKHRGIGCKCTILPKLFSSGLQPKTTTKSNCSVSDIKNCPLFDRHDEQHAAAQNVMIGQSSLLSANSLIGRLKVHASWTIFGIASSLWLLMTDFIRIPAEPCSCVLIW